MSSKLGWHVIAQYADPSDMGKLIDAAAIKIVGDENMATPLLKELSIRYPGKRLIVRLVNHENEAIKAEADAAYLDAFGDEDGARALIAKRANEMMQDVKGWVLRNMLAHVWIETFRNEPAMTEFVGLWDAECLRIARIYGLRMIAGNWSQGYMPIPSDSNFNLWKNYDPALLEINKSGPGMALMGYHNYIGGGHWQPSPSWDYDVLRHHIIIKTVLDPRGLFYVNFIGTEFQFDAPYMSAAGVNNEQAVSAFKSVDELMIPDSRFVAELLFTLDNSQDDNKKFVLRGGASSVFEQTREYQANMKKPVPQPPPSPNPPPPWIPGQTAGTYRVRGGTRLNIRPAPNTIHDPIGLLISKRDAPETVEIDEIVNGWAKISGQDWYISAAYLTRVV